MSEYKAPLRDMHFVLQEMAGLAEVAKLPGFEEINAELVDQILEESAKFASGVLSPLNKPADKEGSKWEKGRVTTPKGFKEAYRQFVKAGWNALQAPRSEERRVGKECRSRWGEDREGKEDAERRYKSHER